MMFSFINMWSLIIKVLKSAIRRLFQNLTGKLGLKHHPEVCPQPSRIEYITIQTFQTVNYAKEI